MDEDNVWSAPKAAVGADPRREAWFGLGAMLWGSVLATTVAGLLMMAMNYRAQGRPRLAWAVVAGTVLVVVPGLCWAFIYLLMSVMPYPVGQVLALVGWIAAQPLATLTMLGASHRRAIAERLRTGQPMRPAAHAALVVIVVWMAPVLLFLLLSALAGLVVVG
ncbi:hypothetical protein [Lysobacter enzymogenes]|uniref:hypothetical protein n=1 Tax=Lysobacter enzymogenes TaxID=69 RepID=UPI001AF23471|nr:hypothetical protein [Lysobacter enzymogenes]QQQ01019.1 hypothetical protein JHW41_23625 [Lysobacter enzymogenes]